MHVYTYNTRIFIVSCLLNLEKRRSCVVPKIAVNQLTPTLRNNFNPTVLFVASSRLYLPTFAFFTLMFSQISLLLVIFIRKKHDAREKR